MKEFLGPTDLKKTQTFYINKLIKVVIVNKNKDLIFLIF